MSMFTLQFTRQGASAEVRVSYDAQTNKVTKIEHKGDATLLQGYFKTIKSPSLGPACYGLTNPPTHDAMAYKVGARLTGARMGASVGLTGDAPQMIASESDPDKVY